LNGGGREGSREIHKKIDTCSGQDHALCDKIIVYILGEKDYGLEGKNHCQSNDMPW
jgi:hypothetical protein